MRYLLGHEADAVTPNGFEDDFVWQGDDYRVKREEARTALIAVAEACLGRKLQDDPLIVGTSGRYEFRNKGLDVLLEGMKRLAGLERLEREVVLYVMVPAANRGARADLQKHLQDPSQPIDGSPMALGDPLSGEYAVGPDRAGDRRQPFGRSRVQSACDFRTFVFG